MKQPRAIRKSTNLQWKKKDNTAIFLIISVGLVLTFIGFFYNGFYDIYFSTCIGLFIGGLILSVISTFLAQMESNISGAGELDAEVDVDIDIDADIDIDVDVDLDIDADVDLDIDADVDIDLDADVDLDIDADVDIDLDADIDIDYDMEAETEIDSSLNSTVTPAPIMLLFSSGFLIFGITGILLYQLIGGDLRFIILFVAPTAAYLTTKIINFIWKIIAKSRFYRISSTLNLIGVQGEVLLKVDGRGGIIKIPSNTPMKFEKLHVKPGVNTSSYFERGEKVYICDVRDGYLLVDNNKKSIKRRRK